MLYRGVTEELMMRVWSRCWGHLPAAAALVELTPRRDPPVVLLNALGGLVYGWLFWRRSLEAAMVATRRATSS